MGMEVETPKPAQIFVVTKGEMGKNVHQDIKEHIGPENYSLAVEFSPGRCWLEILNLYQCCKNIGFVFYLFIYTIYIIIIYNILISRK